MVIGLGIVRNQPWMMGCAKNAMKRTVRRRQILMGPDRAPNEVVANKRGSQTIQAGAQQQSRWEAAGPKRRSGACASEVTPNFVEKGKR